MKQGTFEKEIFIRSDAATVINVIADYSQHHKIHPLIIKVERASEAHQNICGRYGQIIEVDESNWMIPVRIAHVEAHHGLLPCNQRNLIIHAI
ncbi:MAG TPA: hypothetical protein VLA72_19175 [Anaerolineales bacterium]|nr:hypothetical protein [Anaerolineales bacterium]